MDDSRHSRRRAFFHAVRLLYYSKTTAPSRTAPRIEDGQTVETRPVRIHVRNLAFVHKDIHAVARSGHWSIQVGGIFYEFLPPRKSTTLGMLSNMRRDEEEEKSLPPTGLIEVGITHAPDHPFNGFRYKTIVNSTTTLSPDAVDQIVQSIYNSEFKNKYRAGMTDCQRFCMRIFESVCRPEDIREGDSLYFRSYSFAVAQSRLSPLPSTHFTTTKPQGQHVPAHRHAHSYSSGIASQPWFLATLTMPPR